MRSFHHRRPVAYGSNVTFTVAFMIPAFYKQQLVSHYSKPVLKTVLFYVFHRKKIGQKAQPRAVICKVLVICRMSHFLLSISYSSPILTGWGQCAWSAILTCAFSFIPKLIFFNHHLQAIARARPFRTYSYSPIHFIHSFHTYSFHTSSEP